jgi:hypothetical protein
MCALPRTIWATQPTSEARVFDYETSAALAVDSWDHRWGRSGRPQSLEKPHDLFRLLQNPVR